MDFILGLNVLLLLSVALFAGFVKGVVGFAMPLIMYSGFLLFLSQKEAIALIILPTLISNIFQAYGLSFLEVRKFLFSYFTLILVMVCMIFILAQFYVTLTEIFIYVILSILIFSFLFFQLVNIRFVIKGDNKVLQVIFGIIAGFFGGISGQWGPPLVIYFFSQRLSVKQMICYQGIIFSIGSFTLLIGHINSELLNEQLFLLSLPFILVSCVGQYFGVVFRKSQDVSKFRRFVLMALFLFAVFFSLKVILKF